MAKNTIDFEKDIQEEFLYLFEFKKGRRINCWKIQVTSKFLKNIGFLADNYSFRSFFKHNSCS